MNCIEAQRQIMPFINKKLNIEQLDDFINHVNNCSDCMDELEVYYVLLAGMKQLDEDKELSKNFHQELLNVLKQSEERIFHDKLLHIRKRIVLIVLIAAVGIISSLRLGEIVVEDVLDKEVTESNFMVDNLFHIDKTLNLEPPYSLDAKGRLESRISTNLTDIYNYIKERDTEGAVKMEDNFSSQIWLDGKSLGETGIPKGEQQRNKDIPQVNEKNNDTLQENGISKEITTSQGNKNKADSNTSQGKELQQNIIK